MNEPGSSNPLESLMLKRFAADALEILSLAAFLCSVALLAHP